MSDCKRWVVVPQNYYEYNLWTQRTGETGRLLTEKQLESALNRLERQGTLPYTKVWEMDNSTALKIINCCGDFLADVNRFDYWSRADEVQGCIATLEEVKRWLKGCKLS